MPLIRHIAGIPTATEQRCVRCCEVIRVRSAKDFTYPAWPGEDCCGDLSIKNHYCTDGFEDCKPVDLSQREYGVCAYCGKSNDGLSPHCTRIAE
jgi:hypothetical protein